MKQIFKLVKIGCGRTKLQKFPLLLIAAFSKHIVKVPPMGDSIADGVLIDIFAKKGYEVDKDDLLCTIETDKIQVGINAPLNGVVTSIKVKKEQTVVIGQDLFIIDTEAKGKKKSND